MLLSRAPPPAQGTAAAAAAATGAAGAASRHGVLPRPASARASAAAAAAAARAPAPLRRRRLALLPRVRATPPPFTGGSAGGGVGAPPPPTIAAGTEHASAAPAAPAAAPAPHQQQQPQQQQQQQLPLVHVPFRWPAQLGSTGVSRVSVFGSWDGWRQKTPLVRSPVTGDFVRVLALPLDPCAADGAGRQIEYKFEVEYEDDDSDADDGGGGGGGEAAGAGDDGAGGAQEAGGGGGRGRRRKRRVAVRPAPSDPVIRTAAPVFASDVSPGSGGSRPGTPWNDGNNNHGNNNGSNFRRWTESHANNKRLLAPNKLFALPGTSPTDEVLATGDFGGWHAAIRLSWNASARRHEAAASLPAGTALSYRFLVNGRPALAPGGLLPVAPAPPPAPAGRLAHRDAALPPPRAFTLFYATGWPSATLIYRFRLPHLAAAPAADGSAEAPPAVPVTPWQQLQMDVAPSRDSPHGGRWMMAVVEPPPALRRDPWSLERRAEAEAEAEATATTTTTAANRVAALAAAPSPPCELEFFVRGPPVAPPSEEEQRRQQAEDAGNAALAAPSPRHPEEDRGPGGGGGRDRQSSHYVLPAPMAWKLSRGHVRKFPRALRPPCMLVSDLDHTLFAEGEQAAQALARFTAYWEAEAALARSVLVYNTGRSLGQFVSLVNSQQGRLALPDVLVTAVGTKLWHLKAEARAAVGGGGGCDGGGYGGGDGNGWGGGPGGGHPPRALVTEDDWQEDLAWARRLDRGWDLRKARSVADAAIRAARETFSRGWAAAGAAAGPASAPGGGGASGGYGGGGWDDEHAPRAGEQVVNWLDDGSEHPHRVALSSHVRATPFIVAALKEGMAAAGVQARVIVSGAGDWRYVDAVARRAGKAAALEHVRRLYGVPPERTMAAGDSCNDVLMLAAAADGGMGEALAAPLAQAAAAAAAAEAQAATVVGGGASPDGGDGPPAAAAAAAGAAALLMMRDYWAGGGSATFLDEASDLSSSPGGGAGGWAGMGAPSCSAAAGGGGGGEEEDGGGASGGEEGDGSLPGPDGDGGRAPRVKAVVVGNAQRELVEWYDNLRGDTGAASIVLATGKLADGVLEGLMRHGLY